jgi:hypothetical protein
MNVNIHFIRIGAIKFGRKEIRIEMNNLLDFHFSYVGRYSDGLWAARPGFNSRQRQDVLLFSTASRPARGPTQPPIRWVPGGLNGIKKP